MVKRCDMKGCFEKAPYGLSAYGELPDKDDSVELFYFDLCRRHYSELNGAVHKVINHPKKEKP